ncbi:alanine/ornithine racemase family PLP-dependent enzyme [Clostridium sp. D2Q-11]|uniref:Alanine/ornithine racemase family PLP-dependent enzyme n=1 Tax=Anaeromonas frigoriresistens TaxID=2683708 RepID=A0A942V0A6_9FIRM|nr:ornithine racemase Orr [Anaeromonas frigoriresistens]MBS4540064.1 alanine/ornithine racemase family PLP-dependent enzyme [Anaeromonas frigoriresistens]
MSYPKIIINKDKFKKNVERLVEICEKSNISPGGVTKVFCGNEELAKIYVEGGMRFLADSRIQNIKRLYDIPVPKLMLRLPQISEVDEVVKYADISLNSEQETIESLSIAAIKQKKVHDIILMIDLGDLREGIFAEDKIYDLVKIILNLKGVRLIGFGTNLTCYGGVIPRKDNLNRLSTIKKKVEEEFNIQLEILSGGNSSSLHLIETGEMPEEINQLRLGEALVLGRETAFGHQISGTNNDCFKLAAEIIELKEKPSLPLGEIGMDAFGRKPTFIDKGNRKRAICAIGKQDIDIDDLIPEDNSISIIGESSDHLIIDITESNTIYKVGDEVLFNINYGGILKLMTSEYVSKEII